MIYDQINSPLIWNGEKTERDKQLICSAYDYTYRTILYYNIIDC